MSSLWSDYTSIRVFSPQGVAWEVESFQADHRRALETGGWLDFSDWGSIEIEGPDATDYLHRMSTSNLKAEEQIPAVFSTCFLNAKGGALAAGLLVRRADNHYSFWVPKGILESAHNHLEMFVFSEDLELRAEKSDKLLIGIWLPAEKVFEVLGIEELGAKPILTSSPERMAWADPRLNWLGWLEMGTHQMKSFLSALNHTRTPLIGRRAFEYQRTQSGVGVLGRELPVGTLVLEAGLDQSVSENKGCYPGQEVVERIRSYGKVNQALVPVTLANLPTELPCDLTLTGKKVGVLWSACDSPESSESVGLALIRREYWGKELKADQFELKVGEPR